VKDPFTGERLEMQDAQYSERAAAPSDAFPDELVPFAHNDPAVYSVLCAMRNGTMTRDAALVALAVHQTKKCAELMKIACDAVTRHAPPIIISVPRDAVDDLTRTPCPNLADPNHAHSLTCAAWKHEYSSGLPPGTLTCDGKRRQASMASPI